MRRMVPLVTFILLSLTLMSANGQARAGNDEAIVAAKKIVGNLETAWNAGDAAIFGSVLGTPQDPASCVGILVPDYRSQFCKNCGPEIAGLQASLWGSPSYREPRFMGSSTLERWNRSIAFPMAISGKIS